MELNDLVTKADLQSLKMELLVELAKLLKPKGDDKKNIALTIPETSQLLKMPISTLRMKIRTHEIASVKIGKRVVVLMKDALDYLYSNRRKTDAEIRSLIA